MDFIHIRFLDILDIFVVAYLMYQLYLLIKGTVAIQIFAGILGLLVIWLLVKAMNMQLLGSIMGQIMGVGALALIVVFQQEIRRFLIILGTRHFKDRNIPLLSLFYTYNSQTVANKIRIYSIVKASVNLAKTKTGALIVIENKTGLEDLIETGDLINSDTTSTILETIFFKNSPLHDGAVIIQKDKIVAARCILPVSQKHNLPDQFGLRHRAGIGISENTDAIAIIISEETGRISLVHFGEISHNLSATDLRKYLENEFRIEKKEFNIKEFLRIDKLEEVYSKVKEHYDDKANIKL